MELYQTKAPSRQDIQDLRMTLEDTKSQVSMELSAAREEAYRVQSEVSSSIQLLSESTRVNPPKSSKDSCDQSQWAYDDDGYYYTCQSGRWRRIPTMDTW
jgi:hypothetical protein